MPLPKHSLVHLLGALALALAVAMPSTTAGAQSPDSKLRLKFGSGQPVLLGALGKVSPEADYKEAAASHAFDGSAYLILQFDGPQGAEDRRGLADIGVTLLEYVPDHAYLAAVRSNLALDRLESSGVVGYFAPGAENKMHAQLFDRLAASPSRRIEVRISYSGTGAPSARAAVDQFTGARVIQESARFRYLMVEAEGSVLLSLAGLPFVTSVMMRPVLDDGILPSSDLCCAHRNWENSYLPGRVAHTTSSRANFVRSSLPGRLGLTGRDVVVGVGDLFYLGDTHIDLRGRHSIVGNGGNVSNFYGSSDHGMHTSSTVGGAGTRIPRFEGLAPQALVYTAYLEEVFDAGLMASPAMKIASNSYSSGDPLFSGWWEGKGRYNALSEEIDLLLVQEPALLSVHSAGNSGGTPVGDLTGYPENYVTINGARGSAKNTLVVGGNFSYGPTRDGRIKPDLLAGNNVVAGSTLNDYVSKSGSSMSTPTVAGVAALLEEQFKAATGSYPDGALIKAILLNSADDPQQAGPQYSIGFGFVNARRAAQIIARQDYWSSSLEDGGTYGLDINVPATIDGNAVTRMKVMLYWHDPAASAYAAEALVNDLDLLVEGSGGSHLPWALDTTRTNVALPATRGPDHVNNVEQVSIDNPSPGINTVRVTGQVPMGPQGFFVVATYETDEFTITYPMGGEKLFSDERHHVFWDNESTDATLTYSVDQGATWTIGEKTGHTMSGIWDRPSISWELPDLPLTSVLVRLQDPNGRTSTSEALTISDRIALAVSSMPSGGLSFSWNPIAGADSYELLRLVGNASWEVLVASANTTAEWSPSTGPAASEWFAVRAVQSAMDLRSQRSEAVSGHAQNAAPVAVEDVVAVQTGTEKEINVVGNDNDADGDDLFVQDVTSATGDAFATLWSTGLVRYFLRSAQVSSDTLTYTINDAHGGTAVGRLIVLSAPAVTDDALTADSGQETIINVIDNDLADAEYPLTIGVIEVQPSHGTALIDGDQKRIRYTAEPRFAGSDSLRYTVSQGSGETAKGWLRIEVSFVNSAPLAAADSYSTQEDTALILDATAGVLSNDVDPDGSPLQAAIVSQPLHGTATLALDGSLTYAPAENFFGADSLSYVASDGLADSGVASVVLSVAAVNDAPSAAAMVAPADGTTSPITGDPTQTLSFQWTSSEDVESDPITYSWRLATASHPDQPIMAVDAASTTTIEVAFGDLASALTSAGVSEGENAALVHWAVASDLADSTVGTPASISLLRGSITSNETEEIPKAVSLAANYPNPFNPTTVLRFGLPSAGAARVTIYDALGRRIRMAVDRVFEAGWHEISFDAGLLPSGTYFQVLETGETRVVRSMVLDR